MGPGVPGRYQVADIWAMVFAGIAAGGSLLPWGRSRAGPFDHGEAYATLLVSLATLLVFLTVRIAWARKAVGAAAGLINLGFCWSAIDAINETTSVEDPLSLVGGEGMQAGLWMTFVSSFLLFVDALIVRARPRRWPEGPPPSPTSPTSETSSPALREITCQQCSTRYALREDHPAPCPTCGAWP